MAGAHDFISPVEARQRSLERKRKMLEQNRLHELAARQEAKEIEVFGSSNAGFEIRKKYEARFKEAVDAWLTTDSNDPNFPNLSVRLHERLRMIRGLINELSPTQEQPDGD